MTPISSIQNSGAFSEQVLVALRKIIQSIDLHSRSLAKRFGLTGPQLIILREIAASDGISAGKLARAISLSQATVTGVLERLAKRGLVTRQRSEADRRRVLLHATPTAMELLDEAPPLMQESFVEAFNRLPDWEQAMILSALQRLVVLMDARQVLASPILATGPLDGAPCEDDAADQPPQP